MRSHPKKARNVLRNLLLEAAGILALALPLIVAALTAPRLRAQTPAVQALAGTGNKLAFEVTSIKQNRSEDNRSGIGMRPGRFTTAGATTKMLIEFAYNLKDDQLSEGPSWMSSEKYDIDAKEEDVAAEQLQKLPPDQTAAQVRLMVQALLADRFALRVRHETRELPVYALVLAKNGPKLTRTTPPPIQTFGAGPQAFHGIMMRKSGELTATAVSMSQLADVLSPQPEIGGRVVLDRTGLKDNYDFTLQWTQETPPPWLTGTGRGNQGSANAPLPDSSGPSLFTAIQEQLGLRLEATKGPVDVLVINHVEQPSPN